MAIENIAGIGDFDISDEYDEQGKEIMRKRIKLESELDYQNLHEYTPLVSLLKDEYKENNGKDFAGDIKTLVDDYANDMTWLGNNEVSIIKAASVDRTEQQKYDMGLKMHIWDRVHNRDWWSIAADHAASMAASPSNLIGFGLAPFTAGASLGIKGAATVGRAAASAALRSVFKTGALRTVAAETAVGGVGAGVHDNYAQNLEMGSLRPEDAQAMRTEKDYERTLIASAIGAGTAGVFTAGAIGIGKGVRAIRSGVSEGPAAKAFGRTPFEELRVKRVGEDGTTGEPGSISTTTTGSKGGRDGTKGSTTTIDTAPGNITDTDVESKGFRGGVNRMLGGEVVSRIKRGLTSNAGMPQQLADIVFHHRRQLNAKDEMIKRNISDFEVAYKKEFKKNFDELTDDEKKPYMKLLGGDNSAAKGIPTSLKEILLTQRKHIANASQYALDSGIPHTGTLLGKIKMGVKRQDYVHRSYRLHTDPNWLSKIEGSKEWADAKEYIQGLKAFRHTTDSEIRTMLTDIATGPDAHKKLGMLKKKQDIPEAIRKVMGENVDVRVAYRNSVKRMYDQAAEFEHRTKFAEMGGDLGFLGSTAGKVGGKSLSRLTPRREFTLDEEGLSDALIDDYGSAKMIDPLDGAFAHPAFNAAYDSMRKGVYSEESVSDLGAVGSFGQLLFSIGHTVYSPMTVGRNLIGGGALNMAAGNWINPIVSLAQKAGKSSALDKDMTGVGTLFNKLFRKSNIGDEELELLREASEYGIFQQSARAEVLHQNLKDIHNLNNTMKRMESWVESGGKEGGSMTAKSLRQMKRKGIELPVKFYGLMDDLNKLWAWDTEFRGFKQSYGITGTTGAKRYFIPKRLAESTRYGGVSIPSGRHTSTTLGSFSKNNADKVLRDGAKELMVEVDEKVLKAMAAKKSTLYYPTYDQIAPWIKNLRKLPFGNFPSFTAEMTRNTKNNLMVGLEEIYSGNKVMTARGMARLGSLSLVSTGVGVGVTLLASGVSYVTGETEANLSPEEVDAIASLQPYGKGSKFAFQESKGKNIRVANMSHTDPFSIFGDPIRVALLAYQEGNDLALNKSKVLSALRDSSSAYFETFIGTKEGLKPFIELLLLDDLPEEQQDRLFKKFYKALAPKIIQDAGKYGYNAYKSTKYTEWGTDADNATDWLTGVFTGAHFRDVSIPSLASRKLADLENKSKSARKSYKKSINDKNLKHNMTPSDLEDLKSVMREKIEEDIDIQKQILGVVSALRTLTEKSDDGKIVPRFSEKYIKGILSKDKSIVFTTKGEEGVGLRLSGSPISGERISNFTSSNPLYFPEEMKNIKAIEDLNNEVYNVMTEVFREFSNVSLLDERP